MSGQQDRSKKCGLWRFLGSRKEVASPSHNVLDAECADGNQETKKSGSVSVVETGKVRVTVQQYVKTNRGALNGISGNIRGKVTQVVKKNEEYGVIVGAKGGNQQD